MLSLSLSLSRQLAGRRSAR
uniref:Uncharacterized protein n=1 Tax=Arundo donax TaxID=35708 RepID=A0A0A8ZE54_ARUDO